MILLIYYIIQDVTCVLFWTCFSVRSVFILVTKSQHNTEESINSFGMKAPKKACEYVEHVEVHQGSDATVINE